MTASAAPADLAVADSDACRQAIAAVEPGSGLPRGLLEAIALVESGRRDPRGGVSPWPWASNAAGAGSFHASRAEAVAAVAALRARGVRSVDVGCMQVNLLHHPTAFASLEEAFDPLANVRYAAAFLQELHRRAGGDWPRAIGWYHSATPERAAAYRERVLAGFEGRAAGSPSAGIVVYRPSALAAPAWWVAARLPAPSRPAVREVAPAPVGRLPVVIVPQALVPSDGAGRSAGPRVD